ncbi:MAG: hypothetical protein DWI48_02705 [Chloroflexi bacterium]|nr:MAG: hypothetical protein DWI48_02705 [Chloroflexota bacterium]
MNFSVTTVARALIAALILAVVVVWLPSALAAIFVGLATVALVLVAGSFEAGDLAFDDDAVESSPIDLGRVIAPMAEGVLLLDARHAVVAANAAAGRIVNRPTETMIGSSLIVALRDHELAEIVRASAGEPMALHLASSGHDVVATATAVDAGPVQTLLVLEDVTELERARRARTELVANMSHELRTPVAAARALAETLQAGVDDPEAAERFHNRLVEEIGRLGEMVERLLRLSRLESGRETMEDELLQPADLLSTAIARIEPLAESRGRRVAGVIEQLPIVRGDRERVLEVLSNLMDNALRFSPDEGVVTVRALDNGEGLVQFEVSDDGPGIRLDERQRVFERFYTGDVARGFGAGTGLGLSIARHIIERLGGRIWVSDRSPGATLCFTLPLADVPAGDSQFRVRTVNPAFTGSPDAPPA